MQQYSKTHDCLEGLPSALPIHNVDSSPILFGLFNAACLGTFLSNSKEAVLSLSLVCSAETLLGLQRREDETKGQTTVYTLGSRLLLSCKCVFVLYLSYLSVTLMCGCVFFFFRLSRAVNDKMCSLFVFVWFAFCRSLASLSSPLLFDPVHTFVLSP